jgi:hypothetical protein
VSEPGSMSARAVRVYREVFFDLNIRHFHKKPRDDHKIDLSYTRVQQALQGAGPEPKTSRDRPRGLMASFTLHHRTAARPGAIFGE